MLDGSAVMVAHVADGSVVCITFDEKSPRIRDILGYYGCLSQLRSRDLVVVDVAKDQTSMRAPPIYASHIPNASRYPSTMNIQPQGIHSRCFANSEISFRQSSTTKATHR
jgi:hypothetical protein